MKHELKTWPVFFQASWAGVKPFEIRKNDRKFQGHDEVCLQEWDPDTQEYTGREIDGFIRYISDYQQKPEYIVFTVDEIGRRE